MDKYHISGDTGHIQLYISDCSSFCCK